MSDIEVDSTIAVARCAFGDGRRSTQVLIVEGQEKYLVVCTPCKKKLENQDKDVRCQYCGVPIQRNWRKSALDGFKHVPNCPRSDEVVMEIG